GRGLPRGTRAARRDRLAAAGARPPVPPSEEVRRGLERRPAGALRGWTVAGQASAAPLEGVRVLDFTTAMAGPTATMLLADFGAHVVKVEQADGESSRHWGVARFGSANDIAGLFAALNRNKASIVLDLKSQEGRERALALAGEGGGGMES